MIVADPPGYALHFWNGEALISHHDTADEHTIIARYGPSLMPLVQMLTDESNQS
jgi:hypothetical protein